MYKGLGLQMSQIDPNHVKFEIDLLTHKFKIDLLTHKLKNTDLKVNMTN
jgi:hypothetical protein